MDQLLIAKLARTSARIPSCINGIAFAFALEQFFTTEPLRVVPVPDLVPVNACIQKVRIEAALGDDTFQVAFASEIEELLVREFYVITI
jgi:hypothetical protein